MRFYSSTPDEFEYHATEKEAREAAEFALTLQDDHWPENVECTEYGRLVPIAVAEEYDRKDREDYTEQEWTGEVGAQRDWDYMASYRLVPADPPPAYPVQWAAVQMAMALLDTLRELHYRWERGIEDATPLYCMGGRISHAFGGSLEREP